MAEGRKYEKFLLTAKNQKMVRDKGFTTNVRERDRIAESDGLVRAGNGGAKMLKSLLLAGAVALSMSTAASAATIIFSDDFDSETLKNNGSLSNWNVSNGTIDVIGVGGPFDLYLGNGRYVDMDGSTRNAGRIETKSAFELIAGQTYELTFMYGRNTRGNNVDPTETLNFGFGSWSDTLNIPSGAIASFLTRTVLFSFQTNVIGSIFFEDLGADNQGVVIDNVSLSAVPLPAGGLMLVGGLAALAGLRRRKHA